MKMYLLVNTQLIISLQNTFPRTFRLDIFSSILCSFTLNTIGSIRNRKIIAPPMPMVLMGTFTDSLIRAVMTMEMPTARLQ